MTVKKRKRSEKRILDSIRKPTAPPSVKLEDAKREQKADKVGRKSKHKRPDSELTGDRDVQ